MTCVIPPKQLKLIGITLFIAACGTPDNDSSSSSSSQASQSSSSSYASAPPTSEYSALDWDWSTEAKDYCQQHEQVTAVPGTFEILRPEQSQYLHPSEHFVLRWNDGDGVNISQTQINQALNTLESVWDKYINELGFPEPYWDTATKYKVSVNVSNQGYASGAGTGDRDPEMWVHYDALAHIGTLAHEFAHTLQFTTRSMRDSQYVGWLWESHANWMAHQYNPNDVQCTEALVNAPHIYYGSTRNRYCNWQFFEFIKDNSCTAFVNDALWKNGVQPEDPAHWSTDPFSTLASNANWDTQQLNDIFADWALHNTHWDYSANGQTYHNNYGDNDAIENARRFRVTRLTPLTEPNSYAVPHYWAPQRWGYNLVKLLADENAQHITVQFNGMIQDSPAISSFDSNFTLQPETLSPPNSDWRWSVAVTQEDGTPRYSEIQRGASGSLQVDIKPTDKSIWLVVMATPSEIQKIFWDQIYYSIYRYPWQISLEGAHPEQFYDHSYYTATSGAPHPNGGGWVASTAQVDSSAYIASDAKVLGNARISGNVRAEDFAIIAGSANISGDSVIRQNALVSGNAIVQGNSIIQGHAAIIGGTVKDNARVGALSIISGSTTEISGNAVVEATMNSINGRTVSGQAKLFGDIELNTNVNNGVFYGYIDNGISSDPSYGANRTTAQPEITYPF